MLNRDDKISNTSSTINILFSWFFSKLTKNYCMEIREKIVNKILKNDGKILHKYTVEKYAQKYFTDEEYKYIYSIDGKTIAERLWKIVGSTGVQLHKACLGKQRAAKSFNKKTFYIYEGEKFGSSQELYFWIYCKDNGIKIQRNKRGFKYKGEKGKQHMFFPDFYLIDTKELVEIKGSHLRDTYIWKQKEKVCKENNIKVYYTDCEDCKKFRDFIWSHYGKDYIKRFKIRRQKRNVVYIDENTDLFEKRNDNVKYLFICQNCGKEIVTSYKTVKCAGLLCKQCRKK